MKNLIVFLMVIFTIIGNAQVNGEGSPKLGANWKKEVTVRGYKMKNSGRISRNLYNHFHEEDGSMGNITVIIDGKKFIRKGERRPIIIDRDTIKITRVQLEKKDLALFEQYADQNRNYAKYGGLWIWSYSSDETRWIMERCGNGIPELVLRGGEVIKPQPKLQTVVVQNNCCCQKKDSTEYWKQKYFQLKQEVIFLQQNNQDLQCQLDFVSQLSNIFIAYNNREIRFNKAKKRLEALQQNHPCAYGAVVKLKRRGNGFAFGGGLVIGAGLGILVKSIFNTEIDGKLNYTHNQPDGDDENYTHLNSALNSSVINRKINRTSYYSSSRSSYRPGQRMRANSMAPFGF